MKIPANRIVAFAVLLPWLWQASYFIYAKQVVEAGAVAAQSFVTKNRQMIEDLNKRGLTDIDINVDTVASKVRKELIWGEIKAAVMVSLGIIAVMMAWFGWRYWRYAIIATCVADLIVWHIIGTTSRVPLKQAYELKWMKAQVLDRFGDFIVLDVLTPIIFVSVITYLALQLARVAWLRRKAP